MPWTNTFTLASISFKDLPVLSASFLTSSATTANPLPCSPALAASIAALSASKLVCSAISFITPTMFLISSACLVTSDVLSLTFCIEELISSIAAADC
ncbi:hypothetical protein HEBU111660_08950 [Helicobacter burdigaliensis]